MHGRLGREREGKNFYNALRWLQTRLLNRSPSADYLGRAHPVSYFHPRNGKVFLKFIWGERRQLIGVLSVCLCVRRTEAFCRQPGIIFSVSTICFQLACLYAHLRTLCHRLSQRGISTNHDFNCGSGAPMSFPIFTLRCPFFA